MIFWFFYEPAVGMLMMMNRSDDCVIDRMMIGSSFGMFVGAIQISFLISICFGIIDDDCFSCDMTSAVRFLTGNDFSNCYRDVDMLMAFLATPTIWLVVNYSTAAIFPNFVLLCRRTKHHHSAMKFHRVNLMADSSDS